MIKKVLIGLVILIGILAIFLLYQAYDLGVFRKIENPYQGTVEQTITVKGSEDFAISRKDSFLIVSSCDFGQLRGDNPEQGSLGFIDLRGKPFVLKNISGKLDIPLYPHGISMIEIDSAQYHIYVINHRSQTEHTIEILNWQNDSLSLVKTLSHDLIHSPNDLFVLGPEEFYITNDHGSKTESAKKTEDYLRLKKANVIYYNNGEAREVANQIAYANGVTYDAERNLVFVASPSGFLIKVYDKSDDGSLDHITDIDCNTGVDNLELDEAGNIWTGAHPSPLAFASYASAPDGTKISPSEVVKITYNDANDYSVESIFMDDGSLISGTSVAIPFGENIFVGAVKHDQMVVLGE